ncbi:hypothetical protein [Streptomyces mangrovisoli]|uniref:Uncharacterized protein n=1 Tax=Streptomyces mangrovisoli TaxID=1428628 RepID=A0A1J4NWY6_9ACTN|nr:hypothetical protein [Streptomyces mangrovisoli]OIJ66824.1 hypothetical protein WN71_016795 [Streptomyces mangrovisoli]
MTRLSREKKRDTRHAVAPAGPPIDIRVPAEPGVGRPGAGVATVGGVPVAAAPGEEIQHTILDHLHRIALSTGRPVFATVRDDRIGYVVPLQVDPDGASRFTADPVPTAPPGSQGPSTPVAPAQGPLLPPAPAPAHVAPPQLLPTQGQSGQASSGQVSPGQVSAGQVSSGQVSPGQVSSGQGPAGPVPSAAVPSAPEQGAAPVSADGPVPSAQARSGAPGAQPGQVRDPHAGSAGNGRPVDGGSGASGDDGVAGPGEAAPAPRRDKPTHHLRQVGEPVRDATPTFPLRSVPEPTPLGGAVPHHETAPTFPLRAVPEPADAPPPGTVAAPTGAFGPPPAMDAPAPARTEPSPARTASPAPAEPSPALPEPSPVRAEPSPATATPSRAPATPSQAFGSPSRAPGTSSPVPATPSPAADAPPRPEDAPRRSKGVSLAPPVDIAAREPEPDPKPTPARGFDAVAEAVLGDTPPTITVEGAALLNGPLEQINEAVKGGRIDAAAELAARTVTEASRALGAGHPEVLRLRELTAYIAYLAGDPVRSFRLSLDLAGLRRRAGDGEAAYGNIQSAAAAWRAVRDPEQGLALGRELIGLWTELTAEDGPAADDIEQLESARARMGRLTERARGRRG